MENDGQQSPEVPKPGQVFSKQPAGEPTNDAQQPQLADETPQPSQKAEPEQSELADDAPVAADGSAVEWTASEYLDHQKTFSWYFGLALLIIVITGLVYFFVKSIFTAIMVLLIGLVFGIAARRQPRTLNYGVNSDGVKIGEKYYPYEEFKSFSITQEGGLSAMVLVPFKRLMPPITIYYEPTQGDEILTIVSNYLPNEEHAKDPVEQLMHRVKF